MDLDRCKNVINRLCALDRAPTDPFQQFLDFDPTHRGVTGVICAADLTENRIFRLFWLVNLFRPALIDLRTLLIDFVN